MLDGITQKLIAIAEDNPDEVILLQHAISRAKLPISSFHFCLNGIEMTQFLERTASAGAVPDLALVDLKMPLMDGFDVLAWLRGQEKFNTLPVVVLSSSKLEADVGKSREMGVYDYRVKPQRFEDLVRLLDDVRRCWLDEKFNRHQV